MTQLALAQTCRQPRSEYLPICRRALRLKLREQDVTAFFNTFHPPDENRVIKNVDLAPRALTILVGPYDASSRPAIDILPFIQLHYLARTQRLFEPDSIRMESRVEVELARNDIRIMQRFLTCQVDEWKSHVTTSAFHSIFWRRVHKVYVQFRPQRSAVD
ncbi:hypothetical protein BU23DRAFT_557769 [Bimuria novae-zelandiae CBS 107.79]|uniref:Uncharacterized protein n=1 Tax=Bimuria novae-zelandiae CBS 107.79 TaxID=1447943 RepID=A0A6A5UWV7_9PLEO|nr:hypothetical protein BU23DRAFT_557769 [Bimuria novae-zelandiae CBS 107.79]